LRPASLNQPQNLQLPNLRSPNQVFARDFAKRENMSI